jgi:hypothetical protein
LMGLYLQITEEGSALSAGEHRTPNRCVVKRATNRGVARRVSIFGTPAPLFIVAHDKAGEPFFGGP